MLEKANKALEDERYKEAVEIFSDVIANDSNNSLAYQGLAKAFYVLESFDEAKRNCEKAIGLDSNLPIPYTILSYIEYKITGDIEQCNKLAKKAFSLGPDFPETLECLGFICLLQGKNGEGIQYLERALPNASSKYAIYNNLSIAYVRVDRLDDAYNATLSMYKIKPSLRVFIKSVISFMSLKKVKNISSVVLPFILLGSIYLKVLLLVPLLYALVLLIIGIFALLQKATRAGILAIFGSLVIFIISLFFYLFSA
jgi:tetratricopeptide (TPR) repeat protein